MRRLKEDIRLILIVTRGAAVEESHKGLKLEFRAEDVGADRWIVLGAYVHMSDWTYVALPMAQMFRMPFVRQFDLMRKTLETDAASAHTGKWKNFEEQWALGCHVSRTVGRQISDSPRIAAISRMCDFDGVWGMTDP
ncbi:hypothetical protein BJV74DRAFT_889193 [Russula compacta]|nr:hypothetical protein BJV74DRAFT_889193 [Russula compacta]